jgi:cadmium resistance protein CadD (predicted permease)
MEWLLATIKIGLAAAVATTFDDNIYLTAFFSEVNRTFRPKHIVVGELLGFTVLMAVSLIGFVVGLVISTEWIGLLGFLPVAIGLNNLRTLGQIDSDPDLELAIKRDHRYHGFESRRLSLAQVIADPQTYKVAGVNIANGGNNLGIYIPLFASSTLQQLMVIIPICYLAVCT